MLRTETDHCHELVKAIEQVLGRPLKALVRTAFQEVPRHLFVSHYYEKKHLQSAPPSIGADWEFWLSQIYRDEALTTQIDQRGRPTSSSSQPSVMAYMIEQLDVQEGHRVLEIGTGTGYNAALIQSLVGASGHVTTLDIDPDLVRDAAPRIEQVGGRSVTAVPGNGLSGYPPHAPYDRIMVTGSWPVVAQAWGDQLVPGGRLVMNLRGSLSGGLLTLIKHEHNNASGTFAQNFQHISFMSLQESRENQKEGVLSVVQKSEAPLKELAVLGPNYLIYQIAAHFCDYDVFGGHDWNFWLQWALPNLCMKWRGNPADGLMEAVLIKNHALLTIKPGSEGLVICGNEGLWLDLVKERMAWDQAGQPAPSAYQMLIFHGKQFVVACEGRGGVRAFQIFPSTEVSRG